MAAASASCVLVALAFLVAIVVRGKRQRRRRRNPGLEASKGIHQDQQRQALVAGGGPRVGWNKQVFLQEGRMFCCRSLELKVLKKGCV